MKLEIFCVRDRAIDQYGNPMFLVSHGQAIRSFSDEVNRDAADNNMFRHSDDFDLYFLGVWDTQTGKFEIGDPEQIAIGKNVRLAAK